MPKLTFFSSRHFLVLSLALNVSLILRLMLHEGEEPHSHSCFGSQTGSSIARTNSNMLISSSNSNTCTTGAGNRVINLDHVNRGSVSGSYDLVLRLWYCSLRSASAIVAREDRDNSFSLTGDPRVYERFWRRTEFAREVVRLHTVVGNAVTEGRHIVVGTGSSQLFLAALYALSPTDAPEPISVVCASPYYSSYPSMTNHLKSGLYQWGGDAASFEKEGPYIELVTSPNNPDGHARISKVNRSQGFLVHDLAYYWPQYTPISAPADHDLTLFTVSKTTGHAGMRIGWALVKDKEVAKKMTKFIELNTIGVSKDSQLRAAKVLRAVSDSWEQGNSKEGESFFKFSHKLMANRWKQLRLVVEHSELFSLPKFSQSFCTFFKQVLEPQPAFVWLKCEGNVEDCESFLRAHNILTRSGKHFGVSPKYVRISMLDTDENFSHFLERLSAIKS
ncbi:Tryptophan aminotransferase-related protein [Vigna angularis]|uniref:Tryptophan aminotransferase-related protein n=1 Tax=Phaseolus angularis TaxID=3914 RepID=A0A8T0KIP0_PHAAN|nr:Tryptophan aminotransferase-related protein [Vigna angularis]